jgi:UDP-N-acetylglucosamine diphosphorylase/glucosamine-1-phosphate N-acetyltransferase
MHICVFEDAGVHALEPLTLTRPAFDLWCGSFSLLQRHCCAFAANEVSALVRPSLVELCRLAHPQLAVNEPDCLSGDLTVFVNARWLPPAEPLTDLRIPRVAFVGNQVAYAIVPASGLKGCSVESFLDYLEDWSQILPQRPAGGTMMNYPWDLIEHNAEMLCLDLAWRGDGVNGASRKNRLTVIGPAERLIVDPSARVESLALADTTQGPVIIDREAVVQAFSRLEGPCYIGPESWILGARVRGGTIGPKCRIGGEVEASIVHGYSNKYHEGFLGHSYVGEWVNLAAGTQVSDLRNDYGPIQVTVAGEEVQTGLTKIGAFLGDHTKTALNTLLNTGTVIGAFCHVLPAQALTPKVIPSFCTYGHGQLHNRADLRKLFETAATVMRRRGCELTSTHLDFYFSLYDQTATARCRVLREREGQRRRMV